MGLCGGSKHQKRAARAEWVVLTLLIVPVMLWQYDAKIYEITWIQGSARARMVKR